MKMVERHGRLAVELSTEELDRITIHVLQDYIRVNECELANPPIHDEDAESCRKVIEAALVLLEYNGEYKYVDRYRSKSHVD